MNDPRIDPISPEQRAEPVVVVPYDPAWPATFALLRDRIAPVLGELAVGIEHVGSTAVPGLDAKPIIDVDVVIRHADDLPAVAARLQTLGYTQLGDLGIIGREAFRATADLPRHHLYVCAAGDATLQAHLSLRDALRADDDLACHYASLKRDLAERHRDDRDAYSEGKSAFVASVLRAVHERRERRR
ncbi:MAG TPA: GrpB family protein [Xanthomonadales bacterium]|nr:GrpB family protein [Xanthomonadales bacterium]